MWYVLAGIFLFIAFAAFVGVIVGLVIRITRKSWKATIYSGVILGVAFVLFLVIGITDPDGSFEASTNARATAEALTPTATLVPTQTATVEPTATPVHIPTSTPRHTATPMPAPTPTPLPTATPMPTATPIPRVSASELARAYEANQVAAKARYEDKIALITGEVRSITEARGRYDVKLITDDLWTDIVCKIEPTDIDSILSLEKGQVIAVLGKIKGKGFADIVVDPCSIHQ